MDLSFEAPCYKDESENDVLIHNWKTELQWVDSRKLTANLKLTIRELPDESGKIYTAEEFHKIFWWL